MTLVTFAQAICPTSTCGDDIRLPSGAEVRICMPDLACWNGNLVIYSHGFVSPTRPIEIPEEQLQLLDGTPIPPLVNSLGNAFAVTSFRTNGLVLPEAEEDLLDVVAEFRKQTELEPRRIYLNGVSQGGAVAVRSIERYPEVYNGAVAACAPIGNFRKQVNYLGDFRVIFDYFFPNVLPGSVAHIPPEEMTQEKWDNFYVPRIVQSIQSKPLATWQLLRVTRAAVGLDPQTVAETVVGVLWYNFFGTNDANKKLGGQPFGNKHRVYRGSFNDRRLNRRVQRYRADSAAVKNINANFQTSGTFIRALVTQHNIADPIVPYWHEWLFKRKAKASGSDSLHVNLPALRYGHCTFTAAEALLAFGIMAQLDIGQSLPQGAENLLPAEQRGEFLERSRKLGIAPR